MAKQGCQPLAPNNPAIAKKAGDPLILTPGNGSERAVQ